jgi:predicted phage terminase large subunit-like protein
MTKVFAPASKKQEMFLQSDANIIVYGGAMGGGKSYCGLLRHLRWVDDPNYRGYIVRKNQTTIMKSGGLFDEATTLYREFEPKVKINKKAMTFTFPSGAIIAASHLETDDDAEKWRGLQVSAAMVDEATQLSEDHTLVILSRLRSKADMVPNLFLTCNPSPDSYLRRWIDWWIYPKDHELTGRPNVERDGVVRWFIRQNNEMVWADTRQELLDIYGNRDDAGDLLPDDDEHQYCRPLSLQFISATIYDNPPLIKSNPGYLANLQGLKRVKKERDLYGNWDIREDAAGFWKAEWLGEPVYEHELEIVQYCRAWDIAGSLPCEALPNPDWTAGVLIGKTKQGFYVVLDVVRFRARFGEVMQRIIQTSLEDPDGTQIILPQEPGQAGKAAGQMMIKELISEGLYARMRPSNKSKVVRFQPFVAASEAGLVRYVRGDWNDTYFSECEGFDGSRSVKDDQVDATSDSFITLAQKIQLPNFLSGLKSSDSILKTTNPFN